MPTCLKSKTNILSGSMAAKGTETYKQLDTRIDTLLQNYKVQATKIISDGDGGGGSYGGGADNGPTIPQQKQRERNHRHEY